MAELSDADIESALQRGLAARRSEPRAVSARFNPASRTIEVELANGCGFSFPVSMAQGLERAAPEQLGEIEILGSGYGLHWEALDVDLSIPGLLAGMFGVRAHMARQAGRSTSSAKAAAARANGAKGGRPRKSG